MTYLNCSNQQIFLWFPLTSNWHCSWWRNAIPIREHDAFPETRLLAGEAYASFGHEFAHTRLLGVCTSTYFFPRVLAFCSVSSSWLVRPRVYPLCKQRSRVATHAADPRYGQTVANDLKVAFASLTSTRPDQIRSIHRSFRT